MIIEHEGLDGSGKSYGMAMDASRTIKRERGRKNAHEIWSLRPMEGAGRLTHPHQILFLTNSIIFLDELQRYYPADNRLIDEITQHIVSTHRHDKNIIHYATQSHEYINAYWRRETSYVWRYRAIWRDVMTGESKIKRHERTMITGVDRELGRRRPEILRKERFWITKKGIARFNSYEKIDVVYKEIDANYIATLTDPHYSTPDALVNPNADTENDHDNFKSDNELQGQEESVHGKDNGNVPGTIRKIENPIRKKRGQGRSRGKYRRKNPNKEYNQP
jgi:hypothetical protein